ncbi:MAG TPA: hypothetical protein VGM82_02505 [Gemmatimonadaceae bacterium]|jgi:hypothetical protein
MVYSRRRAAVYAALAISLSFAVGAARFRVAGASASSGPLSKATARLLDDSLRGYSGKLLARFVDTRRPSAAATAFFRLFGNPSDARPGIYHVDDSTLTRPFLFIALFPFASKHGSTLGSYNIGFWPGESRAVSAAYANPAGFIEVTQNNADTRLSEHFRLRDFLTHDQANVWPKYLVLRDQLVDKLELIIADLNAHGHPVVHMSVMSGFRTPQYNANGGSTAGRSTVSRHMYGDASDVFVDNNGDGRMDDLNGDGRIDFRDAQVVAEASTRVERAYPDLMGGGGVYKETGDHGPFAHIDVRGNAARWGLQ